MVPVIPSVTWWFARLSCLLLLSLTLTAGAAPSTHSSWSMQVWKSDDGLPNNHVTGLAQTPDGYLWVATYSRPARFDGIRFEEFSPSDFAGINDKIAALLLSPR